MVVGERADGDQRRDFRLGRDVYEIDDRFALGGASGLRNLVHLEPEAAPVFGEDEDIIMRRRDEEMLDEILVLERGAIVPASPTPLLLVRRHRSTLDVAGV